MSAWSPQSQQPGWFGWSLSRRHPRRWRPGSGRMCPLHPQQQTGRNRLTGSLTTNGTACRCVSNLGADMSSPLPPPPPLIVPRKHLPPVRCTDLALFITKYLFRPFTHNSWALGASPSFLVPGKPWSYVHDHELWSIFYAWPRELYQFEHQPVYRFKEKRRPAFDNCSILRAFKAQ